MNSRLFLALGAAAAFLTPLASAAAQETRTRVYQSEPSRAFNFAFGNEDEDRAVIGITTSSGSARDTLGVLVSSITPGGPAEKAGMEEGNRIASINGVNLKVSPADVGDWDISGIMTRRFTREMAKVKAGSDVELRVYSSGQVRTVKLKTVTYDSLYRSMRRTRSDDDDRAAIGVNLGSSGSKRDTLGVLITWIDDNGPAAKAGLEEGNRIAGIGSVDLRVSREDAGDELISGVKVQRLQRELQKLKPGDEVDLRVYGDGRFRTVKVKTVEMSSLNRGRRGFYYSLPGGGAIAIPRTPPVPMAPLAPGVIGRTIRVTM
jgi:S1-C subfamily serine protease